MFNTLNNINAVMAILSLIQLVVMLGFIMTYGLVGIVYAMILTTILDLGLLAAGLGFIRYNG